MATATATPAMIPDRRGAAREQIDHLLLERREMLVLFCRVAGLDPFTAGGTRAEILQAFCQILVDYMATAHFFLYRRIADGTERRQAVMTLARELFARIEACTETAVSFNDKYDGLVSPDGMADLYTDLSALGEALATRIELEDRLIGALLGSGRSTPPQSA